MNESVTIPKNVASRDDRDFDFLREQGLRHIEAMSRKLWTDYNSHDPGITLLEALCYAITDLGNRINLPIRDLLSSSDTNLEENFPTAKKILTTKPVSESDYRKLFIDIEGVNNAFIAVNKDEYIYSFCSQRDEVTPDFPQGKLSYNPEPDEDYKRVEDATSQLKGLYNIRFEPDHDVHLLPDAERKERIETITGKVKEAYHANRNLCEDLVSVQEVDYLKVLVCGDIELEHTADATDVLVEILFRISEHLSPSVKRYSLNQLLDKGMAVEDIFDGPVLQHGFIPTDELQKANIKREIHLSDLVQIVMETEGVADIRKLKMGRCEGDEVPEEIRDKTKQKWRLCIDEAGVMPSLCTEQTIRTTNLFKDVIPMDVDPSEVITKLNERIRRHQQSLQLEYEDIPAEEGQHLDLDTYRSVQNDLPQLYGTGEYGLSPSLPPERHAKAKQLKGYLLFFDQILATYFGHLQNTGKLLSNTVGSQSYFATEVKDVKGLDELVKDAGFYDQQVEQIIEKLDDFDDRKNALLDHLLARFAENMNEYAFAMLEGFGKDVTGATLWHKSTLLKEYPEISSDRALAFNYYAGEEQAWDTQEVTGLQHRLARLLGIRDYSRRNLTDLDYDIYQEEDEDTDENEWRWRLKDKDGEILFSGSKHYPSKLAAAREMWTAVSLAWNPAHYDVLLTEDEDEFYFNLVDENKEVVARHIDYFDTREEAEAKVQDYSEYIYHHVADEGFYVFEHILLRPDRDDAKVDEKFMKICMDRNCKQCHPADPYSLRLTIVFPGWIRRFSNLYFREYAERVIRREVPAHILCRICWIGNTTENEEGEISTTGGQMSELEELYKKWITKKMQNPDDQSDNEFLKPLVDFLHDLETVYPAGRLHDCDAAGEEESEASIILGKSTIGELNQENNGNE